MPNTVFFAWQLDTPGEQNKEFIWEALVQATQHARDHGDPELSVRPEVDTKGVSGAPNIVQTIFDRIRACSVFVADLSFVATTTKGKKIPNPNVMIELGFAARSVGWERTILVLNKALGGADELPFDILQHRWPIVYHVTEKTEVRERRFDALAQALTEALNDCQGFALQRAFGMAAALDSACIDFVAQNEASSFIEMPLPAKSIGQHMVGLEYNQVIRRLIDLGAVAVVANPYIGYSWTHDGRNMIREVNRLYPGVLELLRRQKTGG